MRRSVVKGLSRIFDLSTASLSQRRFSNQSKIKLPRFSPIMRQLRIQQENFQESYAEISCCESSLRFADSVLLKKSFSRSRSSIQFYFIISQARSTAACTDSDLLLNLPIC
jgi:hypothetical protein